MNAGRRCVNAKWLGENIQTVSGVITLMANFSMFIEESQKLEEKNIDTWLATQII